MGEGEPKSLGGEEILGNTSLLQTSSPSLHQSKSTNKRTIPNYPASSRPIKQSRSSFSATTRVGSRRAAPQITVLGKWCPCAHDQPQPKISSVERDDDGDSSANTRNINKSNNTLGNNNSNITPFAKGTSSSVHHVNRVSHPFGVPSNVWYVPPSRMKKQCTC